MTREEKQLLLQDLCARLPYFIEAQVSNIIEGESKPFVVSKELTFTDVEAFVDCDVVCDIKPYLRSMESMTEEEKKFYDVLCRMDDEYTQPYDSCHLVNWLLEQHFDWRGLIKVDLGLPAPEGMYDI